MGRAAARGALSHRADTISHSEPRTPARPTRFPLSQPRGEQTSALQRRAPSARTAAARGGAGPAGGGEGRGGGEALRAEHGAPPRERGQAGTRAPRSSRRKRPASPVTCALLPRGHAAGVQPSQQSPRAAATAGGGSNSPPPRAHSVQGPAAGPRSEGGARRHGTAQRGTAAGEARDSGRAMQGGRRRRAGGRGGARPSDTLCRRQL
ncbi:translation initiation factor IF-2-like [Gallus gallus]|uniref:translation initiation factor IF-2-like n=1 Tax=Gallus gallus TaxID=9031 RepID=UPI001F004991|nr:translation initiation factor IF-2-like [Gallus gallus]